MACPEERQLSILKPHERLVHVVEPDARPFVRQHGRVVIQMHTAELIQRRGLKTVESGCGSNPDGALPVLQDGAGLSICESIRGGIVFSFHAITRWRDAGDASKVMSKPDASVSGYDEKRHSRNAYCAKPLVV